MNNHRLLTGLLAAALCSGGVCADGKTRQVLKIEELFEIAETNSAQLRPSLTAQEEATREISVARSGRLPEIEAILSLVVILISYSPLRPAAIFPKWKSIRRALRRMVRLELRDKDNVETI